MENAALYGRLFLLPSMFWTVSALCADETMHRNTVAEILRAMLGNI